MSRNLLELKNITKAYDGTIILDDLSPLWELPIDDYYFAAVREPLKSLPNPVGRELTHGTVTCFQRSLRSVLSAS